MISGIHHVKLPVSDVARSRAWYERVLGFDSVIEFVEHGGLVQGHPGGAVLVGLHHPGGIEIRLYAN